VAFADVSVMRRCARLVMGEVTSRCESRSNFFKGGNQSFSAAQSSMTTYSTDSSTPLRAKH
jgi:hypothetical protein